MGGEDDRDLLGFEPTASPPTDDELVALARGEEGPWPYDLYVNPSVGVERTEDFGGGRGLYNVSNNVPYSSVGE